MFFHLNLSLCSVIQISGVLVFAQSIESRSFVQRPTTIHLNQTVVYWRGLERDWKVTPINISCETAIEKILCLSWRVSVSDQAILASSSKINLSERIRRLVRHTRPTLIWSYAVMVDGVEPISYMTAKQRRYKKYA